MDNDQSQVGPTSKVQHDLDDLAVAQRWSGSTVVSLRSVEHPQQLSLNLNRHAQPIPWAEPSRVFGLLLVHGEAVTTCFADRARAATSIDPLKITRTPRGARRSVASVATIRAAVEKATRPPR